MGSVPSPTSKKATSPPPAASWRIFRWNLAAVCAGTAIQEGSSVMTKPTAASPAPIARPGCIRQRKLFEKIKQPQGPDERREDWQNGISALNFQLQTGEAVEIRASNLRYVASSSPSASVS